MENKEYNTVLYKLFDDETSNLYTFPSKKLLCEYLEDRYGVEGRQITFEGNTFDENQTVNVLDKWGNKIRSIGFVYIVKE